MEPSNDHERAIKVAVDTIATEGGLSLKTAIAEVAASLQFRMSRSDAEFLVQYIRWRMDAGQESTNRGRILLADDHAPVLEEIRAILAPHYEIVGTVADGRALVEAALRLKPDLIVTDITMPLLNGLDAAIQIKRSEPGTELLFVTMHSSSAYVEAALEAGGTGYVVKSAMREDLLDAVQSVLGGSIYLSPSLSTEHLGRFQELTHAPTFHSVWSRFRSKMEIQSPQPELRWLVKGSYYEVCNCEAPCPCRRQGGRPGTRSQFSACEFVLSWLIHDGHFGAHDLRGLHVALAGRIDYDEPTKPGGRAHPWHVILYVDDRANVKQQSALANIFLGRAGGTTLENYAKRIGQIHDVKSARIELDHTPGQEWLRIGESVQAATARKLLTGETTTSGIPGHDRPGQELVATLMQVEDDPLHWTFTGRCGFSTSFEFGR